MRCELVPVQSRKKGKLKKNDVGSDIFVRTHYFGPLNTVMRKGKDPEARKKHADPAVPDPQHWNVGYRYPYVRKEASGRNKMVGTRSWIRIRTE